MGPGNGVIGVGVGRGVIASLSGSIGDYEVEVGPCSGIWGVEADSGGAYFSPGFWLIGEEDNLIVR